MNFDDPFYSFESPNLPSIEATEDPETRLESKDVTLEPATDVAAVVINGNAFYANLPGQKATI